MVRPQSGKLRIGDEWNAIVLLARTQTNPLKAVGELVENSLDAKGRRITILRGKQRGKVYLSVLDDGEGVRLGEDGLPDFKYVATHICDSIKRHLSDGARVGVHGEFGIGLLGFWSIGDTLHLTSKAGDGTLYEMEMRAGSPKYLVRPARGRLLLPGTEVTVMPVKESVKKALSGDRLERYLAEELRDRIRSTGAAVEIIDKISRKRLTVKPREFQGERLEVAPRVPVGEGSPVKLELHYRVPLEGEALRVGVFRDGTRVKADVREIEGLDHPPWTLNRLEGIVDYPAFNVSPGTREGVVPDERLSAFVEAICLIEPRVLEMIEAREKAETEKASENLVKDVHRALADALRQLGASGYQWFEVGARIGVVVPEAETGVEPTPAPQSEMFADERPGPLARVRIVPSRAKLSPGESKLFVARALDDAGRAIAAGIGFDWGVESGPLRIVSAEGEQATVEAGQEYGVAVLHVAATQDTTRCETRANVSIEEKPPISGAEGEGKKGLPGYRLVHAAGQNWRSRYADRENVIEVNSGHRDYVEARSRLKTLRRYIGKLYAKEIILMNFPGFQPSEVLERMVELLTRMEEKL